MVEYISVRNWDQFQHYKDRDPPWIRLYHRLLDDYEYTSLPDAAKAHLMGIFMLAARTENRIPNDPKWIGAKIGSTSRVQLNRLTHFLDGVPDCERGASGAQSKRKPSRDAHARSASVSVSVSDQKEFDRFWDHYPKRKAKRDAMKAWVQTKNDRPPIDDLIAKVDELAVSKDWLKDGGQFVPYPASWLRAGGWDDEVR